MPDLQPDTSFYPKAGQGQMSIMDLLNLARSAQQLQTDRTISGILGKNTRPDGTVDYEGVRQGIGEAARSGAAPLVGPGDYTATSHAQGAQLDVATSQLTAAAKLLDPFTAPGARPTRAQITPVLGQLSSLGVPAQLIAPILKARDGPELQSALLGLRQSMVGSRDVSTELPGTGGVPGARTTAAGAEQQAVKGGTGLGTTYIPKEVEEERDAAANFVPRTTPVVNLISTVRKLGDNAFGPGSEEVNTLKKTAAFFGATIPDLDKVNDYDKAQKAMAQIADTVSSGGSNARLYQAIAGNPNANMRAATIEDLGKVIYSQEAKRTAITDLGTALGVPNSQMQRFRGQMNNQLDSRAFAFQMISPENRAKLLKSMSPQERARFEKSLDVADQYMTNPPEGGWYVPSERK